MAECCEVKARSEKGPGRCPKCDRLGGTVEAITVKALLRPSALEALSSSDHRFCQTASCPIVYFGDGEAFTVADVSVPVFQKEIAGARTVCYCFQITENDLRSEMEATGQSAATSRVAAHVKAGRCACEIKNPQGSCCLGNISLTVAALAKVQRAGA